MTDKDHIVFLTRLHACQEAIEWARQYESMEEAWQACERGDWMLWLAGMLAGPPMSESRRPLALASARCAELILPHTTNQRVHDCVALTLRFGQGEHITKKQLRDAAAAAYASAAAFAAAAAYASAAAFAARTATLKRCADIVREVYPHAPEEGRCLA